MPNIKITQSILPTLLPVKGRDTVYWDTELTGFAVKVSAVGTRTYIVQSRILNGANKRRIKLNACERMSVKEAREVARKQLASMGLGHDPITQRKIVEMAGMTLRKALVDRIAVKQLKPHTARDYLAIAANAFPDWLDKPLSLITGQMAIDRHRELTKRGPSQANYSLRILSAAFGHARGQHGLQAPNPVTRMREGKLFNKVKARDEYVEPHELPAMLQVLHKLETAKHAHDRAVQEAATHASLTLIGLRSRRAQLSCGEDVEAAGERFDYAGTADAVRTLLLTGFRLNEVQQLQFEFINFDRKVITLTDNKASRTLRMPMCDALCALMERRAAMLRGADGKLPKWVFPTEGEGHYQNLSALDMPTLSRVVSAELGKRFHIHAHKLRHTFATYLRGMGHSEWTVAALLNHSRSSSVTTIYAAPMTGSMHGIVNEYQGYLERLLPSESLALLSGVTVTVEE